MTHPSSNPFFAQATGNNRAIYVMEFGTHLLLISNQEPAEFLSMMSVKIRGKK